MSSVYTVKVGQTIRDVIICGTGSLNVGNWDAVLTANGFTDWTPPMNPGQQIIIPDSAALDSNTIADKKGYPSANGQIGGSLAILLTVWAAISSLWILATGFWNDEGIWIDQDFWID